MKIQDIIKTRRLELKLTIKEVSNALGLSESTVSRYETGDIQNMGIDKIAKLAKVLRCSPGYLMGWLEEPQSNIKYFSDLKEIEKEIISKYRSLTPIEKSMVLKILDIQKIKESNDAYEHLKPVAAHERTDISISQDDIDFDNNIMNDENF